MKIYWMVLAAMVFLAPPVFARVDIESAFKTGSRAQYEVIDEEEDDSRFDFTAYETAVNWREKDAKEKTKWKFALKTALYEKDYSVKDDFDSRTGTYKLDAGYEHQGKGVDIGIGLREKRYSNRPGLEYDRTVIDTEVFLKEYQNFRASLNSGFRQYRYLNDHSKNQDEWPLGVNLSKYFFDERVKTEIGIAQVRVDRNAPFKDKSRKTLTCGLDYKVDTRFWQNISLDFSKTEADTQGYIDWDDNYDYQRRSFIVKTRHPLTENLRAGFSILAERKNYDTYERDYKGRRWENSIEWQVFKNKAADLEWQFQFGRYLRQGRDYTLLDLDKRYGRTELAYAAGSGKVTLAAGKGFYHYRDNLATERSPYTIKIDLEKYFFKKQLILGAGYQHKIDNYQNNPDFKYDIYEVSLKYMW